MRLSTWLVKEIYCMGISEVPQQNQLFYVDPQEGLVSWYLASEFFGSCEHVFNQKTFTRIR